MENKRSGHISEKELDRLLNEAFLNLDFESNSKNKEALSIVTEHVMRKHGISRFFNMRRLDLLFLLLSILVFLSSFYRYARPLSQEEKIAKTVPGIKTSKNEKLPGLQATKTYSVKNAGEKAASLIVTDAHATKKKVKSNYKSKQQNIIPEAVKINAFDSVSALTKSDPEINEVPINKGIVDSLVNAAEKKVQAPTTAAATRESRAPRKAQQLKQNNKVKIGKRRKMNFFTYVRKKKRKSKRFLKTSGR